LNFICAAWARSVVVEKKSQIRLVCNYTSDVPEMVSRL